MMLITTTAVTAKEDNFFFDTYNYAKSSPLLNKAAKCDIAATKLKIENNDGYFSYVISNLTMGDTTHQSHELLEYWLAYDTVKNFHFGRFSMLDEINNENSKIRYQNMYEKLDCKKMLNNGS